MVDKDKMKEEFALRATSAREASTMTNYSIAKHFDISAAAVGKWFNKGVISKDRIADLADLLGVNYLWLVTGEGERYRNIEETNHNHVPLDVPEISYVQAGEFTEALELHQMSEGCKNHPRIIDGECVYVLRVVGDSMTSPHGKSFPEDMLLHVDGGNRSPNNGDYIIARLNGTGDVTFKQFKMGELKPYLHALNPKHDSIYEEFSVLGTIGFAGWEL